MLVTLYSITDQISLPDCLHFEMLDYMFIVFNYCLVCDVTNFEKISNVINFEINTIAHYGALYPFFIQPSITSSKLTIDSPEQSVNYIQK